MVTTVTIPGQFTLAATHPFARLVVGADGFPVDQEITFDFSRLYWIDGSGLTVFCNALKWLFAHGVKCSFIHHNNRARAAIAYLDDCGFFAAYLGGSLSPYANIRPTTLPFVPVPHAEAHGWLEFKFSPWMAYALDSQPARLGSLRTCVKEVFNNILDHSTQDTGFIHLQHYPNLNRVKVTVSDFGLGIPNTMRARFGPMNDVQAIYKASQEGVTAQTQPGNQGLGLCVLIDYVIGNGGAVSIYSYSGGLQCAPGPQGLPTRSPIAGGGSYPGTLIDISLSTNHFRGDEIDRGVVEW